MAGLVLWYQQRNPYYEAFTLDIESHKLLMVRACLAYCVTLLLNFSLTMVSFSLIVLVTQTAPFWTAYIGFKLNKEPGYKLELAGMLLCFIAIYFIMRSEDGKQTELMLAPEGHADDYPLD